jgi:nucleoside 2-deoxyribosyltransferase
LIKRKLPTTKKVKNMSKNKCFLSYAHSDKVFVQNTILPILNELNLRIWLDINEIEVGASIYDTIVKGLREADFVIAVFNGRSSYVNFEVGAALGQGKPVLAILTDAQQVPTDIRNFNFIYFNQNKILEFIANLKRAIQLLNENIIDKSDFEFAEGKKLIGIQIGFENSDYEQELRLTADLIGLLKEISGSENIKLIQPSKGSLKSLLSIDLKSWAELVEKIIFFIPEWKKKQAENQKIIAEIHEIEARARKTNSEANKIDIETKIQQADAFLNLIEKGRALGLKLQLDDDLLLLSGQGEIKIKQPETIEIQNKS